MFGPRSTSVASGKFHTVFVRSPSSSGDRPWFCSWTYADPFQYAIALTVSLEYDLPVTLISVVEPNGTLMRISCAEASSDADSVNTLRVGSVPCSVSAPYCGPEIVPFGSSSAHADERIASASNSAPTSNGVVARVIVPFGSGFVRLPERFRP